MDENPAISTNNLYQVADVTLFPAGDHHVLLHNRHSQATLLVHTEIADLLMKCREFKTLRDHIQSYRHGQPTNVATMSALRRELQKLVHNGYLISNQHIFDQYSQLMKKAPLLILNLLDFLPVTELRCYKEVSRAILITANSLSEKMTLLS